MNARTAIRALTVTAAILGSIVVASAYAAEALKLKTGSEVSITCAAAGANGLLSHKQSYRVKVTNEPVWFLQNSNGDGGYCGSGGTPFGVNDEMFWKAEKPAGETAAVSPYNVCCRSTGGTGVMTFTPAALGAQ